jgi:hypothetical protein
MRIASSILVVSLGITACEMSHGARVDAGPASRADGGTTRCDCGVVGPGPFDAGPGARFDTGPGAPPDTGPPIDGFLVFRDARPPDGGPIGDREGDVWEGYVESASFPSGSDAVRIVFDSATGDGPRTGIVIFGEGPGPGPVTDPSVGYPPDFFGWGRGVLPIVEGFEFPIITASVSGTRVRVSVSMTAPWLEWCSLQTPYPVGGGGDSFMCHPNLGTEIGDRDCALIAEDGTRIVVDCGWISLCDFGGPCFCTAEGCTIRENGTIDFDFSVTADRGDGTISLPLGLRNVHVVRR